MVVVDGSGHGYYTLFWLHTVNALQESAFASPESTRAMSRFRFENGLGWRKTTQRA
jgi:hypothetical protein